VTALALSMDPGSPGASEAAAAQGRPEGPNVIVVMTDDQSLHSFSERLMPHTFGLTDDRQGSVLRGHASPPLCCPARAGFLTGQYPHNHGVFENDWGLLAEPDNTLPAWLQADGYTTGFVGKYLNEYSNSPAPAGGYDSWYELIQPAAYYDYQVSDQGVVGTAGNDRSEYSTTVVTRESRNFIREASKDNDPFFLYSSYFAPHPRNSESGECGRDSALPLAKDLDEFRGKRVKLGKSYNERDIKDKPPRVSNRPRLAPGTAAVEKDRVRCARAAMQAVDRGVQKLKKTLRKEGLANDTVIVYLSDNGSFFGEHRIDKGKYLPYVEAVRVPMLIHAPAGVLGERMSRIKQPVANIDLAPTILDLANAEPCTVGGDCRVMDGRSIVPLMKGNDSAWPRHRPIAVNLRKSCRGYRGVYAGRDVYVNWFRRVKGDCENPDYELYDLRKDPYQLENRLHTPSGGAIRDGERLHELMERLTTCSGIEGRDPQQDQRPFCG
jgi:N-acetylglucosamine-6-sulfatase